MVGSGLHHLRGGRLLLWFLGCQALPKQGAHVVCRGAAAMAAGLPRALTEQVRQLDEHQLRRLMILTRGLLVGVQGPLGPVDDDGMPMHVSYRQEHVRCGREGCGSCPHGPYWYGYYKQEGRTRKQYIGRTLPGDVLEPVVPASGIRPAHVEPCP
jgi:hypothetical protein